VWWDAAAGRESGKTAARKVGNLVAQRLVTQSVSELQNINRRYVSVAIDGRPCPRLKNGTNGAKNRSSSSSAVDPLHLHRQPHTLGRKDRLLQRRLVITRAQHPPDEVEVEGRGMRSHEVSFSI
jgi:hypothetical protein